MDKILFLSILSTSIFQFCTCYGYYSKHVMRMSNENNLENVKVVHSLRSLSSTIITGLSPKYEEAKSIYNGIPNCSPELIDCTNKDRLQSMQGLWSTLATDLKLPLQCPIQNFLYLPEAKLSQTAKEIPIVATLQGLDQYVGDYSSELNEADYNNIMLLSVEGLPCIFEFITFGKCRIPTTTGLNDKENNTPKNRLEIEFVATKLTVQDSKYNDQINVLLEKLGIESSMVNKPFQIKGAWSDVTYLNTESSFRIMTGNNGNKYILVRK